MDPGCVFVESRPRAEVGINDTDGDGGNKADLHVDDDEAGLHVGASSWGAYPSGAAGQAGVSQPPHSLE